MVNRHRMMQDFDANPMENSPKPEQEPEQSRGLSGAQPKKHVPLLLYGVLLFLAGIITYLVGVALGVPRVLFGLSGLEEVQVGIIWYSGVPIVLGVALALIDLLIFFDAKRFGMPLRQEPIKNRKVTVALTAYNDEESIAESVRDFKAHPDVARVIVVSNNSKDETFAIETDCVGQKELLRQVLRIIGNLGIRVVLNLDKLLLYLSNGALVSSEIGESLIA